MEKGGFNKLNFKSILIVAAILIVIISLVVFFFWPKDNSLLSEKEVLDYWDICGLIKIDIKEVNCDAQGFCDVTVQKVSGENIGGFYLSFLNSLEEDKEVRVSENFSFSQEVTVEVEGLVNSESIELLPFIHDTTNGRNIELYCFESKSNYSF